MRLISLKRITRNALLITIALLSACNLQQIDPTPPISATEQQATAQPTAPAPTLRPTPTSQPIASPPPVTPLPGVPTVVPVGGTPANALTPTLNPAVADQRHELQARSGQTV